MDPLPKLPLVVWPTKPSPDGTFHVPTGESAKLMILIDSLTSYLEAQLVRCGSLNATKTKASADAGT